MSTDFIAAQLKEFKKLSIESQRETEEFCHESPFLRTKREVQQELQRAEKYRASILKNVTTFGKFSVQKFDSFCMYGTNYYICIG